ncbi:MAG: hypothetical protein M1820_002248 [Bogoriella megaspora]|nr:MAG: hypothetical protein M1820_002248 [Bogoriella megaspora]
MQIATLFAFATAAAVVSAAPSTTINKRASQCGQWDSIKTGSYTLYQDLWNEGSATSGSQCSQVNGLSGNSLSWSTSWTWQGASNQVKSYANVAIMNTNQVSTFSSIPTTWSWSYTGSNIVADVAYDVFTSNTKGGSNAYEIMIWLAALGGAGPISSTGSPVATPTIGGVAWKLYSGPNGATTVFSFVAQTQQTNFKGDIVNFFKYLETNNKFPSSQYLVSIGAGTEPFTGSNAVLTTTGYSLSL